MNRESMKIVAALFVVIPLAACATEVRPRQPMAGDTWCVYSVKAARGGGAIPVGGTVCIYCPPPATSRCHSTLTIEVAEDIEYDLTRISNSCEDCPQGGHTYEEK